MNGVGEVGLCVVGIVAGGGDKRGPVEWVLVVFTEDSLQHADFCI